MNRIDTWKLIGVIAATALALYFLYPSYRFYTMSPAQRDALPARELATLRSKAIHLGLDLQGGMHLVLEVVRSRLNAAEAKDAPDRAMEIIRNRIDQFGVAEPLIQPQGNNAYLDWAPLPAGGFYTVTYNVYRATTTVVPIIPASLIASTTNAFYTDVTYSPNPRWQFSAAIREHRVDAGVVAGAQPAVREQGQQVGRERGLVVAGQRRAGVPRLEAREEVGGVGVHQHRGAGRGHVVVAVGPVEDAGEQGPARGRVVTRGDPRPRVGQGRRPDPRRRRHDHHATRGCRQPGAGRFGGPC